MNIRKIGMLLGMMLVTWMGAHAAATDRPNFLFVVMDDFGVGQFAPVANGLTEEAFDPELVRYVAAQNQWNIYEKDEALQAARIAMPTLSRLTHDGIYFTQAVAGAALCAPSRCGIMSAKHPNRLGIYVNVDVTQPPGAMHPEDLLAPHFQQAGYATGHIGKWHIGPLDHAQAIPILKKHGLPEHTYVHSIPKDSPAGRELVACGFFGSVIPALHPLANGFDYYYGYNFHESAFYNDSNVWENHDHAGLQKGYNTETFTEKALEFIASAQSQHKPFFLSLNLHAVHTPLWPEPPDRYLAPFKGMSRVVANFYGHVYAVDESMRRITDALDTAGLLENTCLIFTSDNGASVGRSSPLPGNAPHRGYKGQYTLGGIRVPLMIHWPARIPQGRTCAELASHLDILPTAMDAAGMSVPDGLDGASLLPLIDGADKGPHPTLTWFGLQSISWGLDASRAPTKERVRDHEPGAWAVRSGTHLLRYTGTLDPGLYSDTPDGAAPTYELYNTVTDPGETKNIYDQYPEIAAQLKAIAARQTKQIAPPIHWQRARWDELMNSLK